MPYGLPTRRKTQSTDAAPWPEARLLFVGQGIQRKGLHHLIRAWQARLRGDAKLTIVSYRIDSAITRLAKAGSISILGYQSREDLERLFQTHDVFVMPSLLEGFGLVYLKVLSHGCRALATPNTGVPDLGLSRQATSLVEVGDLSDLDASISRLMEIKRNEGFDRRAVAAEGRNWTQDDFRRATGHVRQ